jgi:hypothetical protein
VVGTPDILTADVFGVPVDHFEWFAVAVAPMDVALFEAGGDVH